MRKTAIQRVAEMERIFDFLLEAWGKSPEAFWQNVTIQLRMQKLLRYYEGGQWLKDYLADGKGAFPEDMKRGVLSQDGVWNFLCDVEANR